MKTVRQEKQYWIDNGHSFGECFEKGVEFAERWVPCEEGLPPHKEDIFMKRNDGKMGIGSVLYGEHGDSDWYFMPCGNLSQVYANNLLHKDAKQAITHWRPITHI